VPTFVWRGSRHSDEASNDDGSIMSNHREFSLGGRGSGGVLEEDESLARMLQQQLLEEEHRAQRVQRRTANNDNHLTQQELDDMELARRMAQMDYDQHRRSSREDHLARARRLQEQAFSNVSSSAAASVPQQPSRGLEEQLAYARTLQEQAFSNVASAQQMNASSRQAPRTTEESDLELALRMQEMEEMGLSSSRASGLTLSPEAISNRSFSADDSGMHSRWQQEEEDARLARLMEGGASLRELQNRESASTRNDVESAPQSSSSIASMPSNASAPVASIPRQPPTMPVLVPAGLKPPPAPPAPIPSRPTTMAYPVANAPTSVGATMNNNSSSSHSRTPTVSTRNTYPAAAPRTSNTSFPSSVVINTDPPGLAIPNEAAFLDASVDGSKTGDKQKRRGFLGIFRRSSKSDHMDASTQSRQSARSTQNRTSRPGSKSNRPPATTAAASLPPVSIPAAIPAAIPPPPPPEATGTGPLPHSISVSQNFGHNEATAQKKGTLATCSTCKRMSTNLIVALDKKYHPDCLRCVACHQTIDATQPFAFITDNQGEKQPLHRPCYAGLYGVKCAVCKQSIPAGEDGKVSFVKHPFFDTEQMCPRHASNPGRRCTGCHRFEPEDEPFADLNDAGRCVCFACCRSVVVDSDEATVLWKRVVDFFEKLGLPIWKDMREVPILIVGYDALNNQIQRAGGSHGNSTQIMTRGLCLTEHESGRKIKLSTLRWNKNNFSFEACDAELKGFTFFQVPDASKVNPDASVTAILCLSGLPSDLVASVLAHEATHAWIKLHPRFDIANPIPPQVEEGVAQLLALLFLNDGLEPASRATLDVEGPTDEKLRQYFKFSIETDDNEIYGEGYRKAAAAYANIGIEALMSHVVLYQEFPRT
jgi:hypothetical protein